MHTLSLILHTLAAAVLVGPQLLMFYAVVPATWLIERDERLRRDVLRVVTQRFARIAVGAFVVLVATGLYLYFAIPAEIRAESGAINLGWLFSVKMVFVVALVGLTYWHVARYAGRIAALSVAVIAGHGDAGELESARLRSFSFSIVIMLVSVATLVLGVALGDHEFAWSPR